MAQYNRGETIIISAEVATAAGVLTDPTTSITVSIRDCLKTLMVDDVAMLNDGTGLYHYDYTVPANGNLGIWNIWVKAVNGTRVTVELTEAEIIAGIAV